MLFVAGLFFNMLIRLVVYYFMTYVGFSAAMLLIGRCDISHDTLNRMMDCLSYSDTLQSFTTLSNSFVAFLLTMRDMARGLWYGNEGLEIWGVIYYGLRAYLLCEVLTVCYLLHRFYNDDFSIVFNMKSEFVFWSFMSLLAAVPLGAALYFFDYLRGKMPTQERLMDGHDEG